MWQKTELWIIDVFSFDLFDALNKSVDTLQVSHLTHKIFKRVVWGTKSIPA